MKQQLTLEQISRGARVAKGLPEHDFAEYGQLGGMVTSDSKSKASKRNGRKGERSFQNADRDRPE